jgi:hypothetical protein
MRGPSFTRAALAADARLGTAQAPAWEADRPGRRRPERWGKDFLVPRLFKDLQPGKFSRRSVPRRPAPVTPPTRRAPSASLIPRGARAEAILASARSVGVNGDPRGGSCGAALGPHSRSAVGEANGGARFLPGFA